MPRQPGLPFKGRTFPGFLSKDPTSPAGYDFMTGKKVSLNINKSHFHMGTWERIWIWI